MGEKLSVGDIEKVIQKATETREKLSIEDIEKVIQAALTIGITLTGRTSKKGQGYWEDVFYELERIADTGEP